MLASLQRLEREQQSQNSYRRVESLLRLARGLRRLALERAAEKSVVRTTHFSVKLGPNDLENALSALSWDSFFDLSLKAHVARLLAFRQLALSVRAAVCLGEPNLFSATEKSAPRISDSSPWILPTGTILKEQTPVRLDLTHSCWSDIFYLSRANPHGARVVNIRCRFFHLLFFTFSLL